MVKKIAPALAAGCVVVAKAPEETPGCTSAIMRCLDDAGIPAGVAQLVYGVPDTLSRHLLPSPLLRKVSFIGSTAVGTPLLRRHAGGVKGTPTVTSGRAPVLGSEACANR